VDLVGLHGGVPSGVRGRALPGQRPLCFHGLGGMRLESMRVRPTGLTSRAGRTGLRGRVEFVIYEALGELTKGGDGSSSSRGAPLRQHISSSIKR
jgi:hypothetical protein